MKTHNQNNFTVELGKTYIDVKGNKVKIKDTFTWANTSEKLFTGKVKGVCYTRGGLCFRHLMGVVSISNENNLVKEYIEPGYDEDSNDDSAGYVNLSLTEEQYIAVRAILNYVRLGEPDDLKINPYRVAISKLLIDLSDMEYGYENEIEYAENDIFFTASNDEGPVIEFRDLN